MTSFTNNSFGPMSLAGADPQGPLQDGIMDPSISVAPTSALAESGVSIHSPLTESAEALPPLLPPQAADDLIAEPVVKPLLEQVSQRSLGPRGDGETFGLPLPVADTSAGAESPSVSDIDSIPKLFERNPEMDLLEQGWEPKK